MLLHDKLKPHMVLEHELAQRTDYDDTQDGHNRSGRNKGSTDKDDRSSNRGQSKPHNNYSNRGQNWRGTNDTGYHNRSYGRGTRGRYGGRNNYYSNNSQQQQRQDQNQYRPRGRQNSQPWHNRSSYGYAIEKRIKSPVCTSTRSRTSQL